MSEEDLPLTPEEAMPPTHEQLVKIRALLMDSLDIRRSYSAFFDPSPPIRRGRPHADISRDDGTPLTREDLRLIVSSRRMLYLLFARIRQLEEELSRERQAHMETRRSRP